jgi:hypothetical protein
MMQTTSPGSPSNDTSLERSGTLQKEGRPVASPELCLHRIDNGIAEGVAGLPLSADGGFPAGIADADGRVIGRQGKIPITVYVMVEL